MLSGKDSGIRTEGVLAMQEEKEYDIYEVQEQTQSSSVTDAAYRMEQAAYAKNETYQANNKKRKNNVTNMYYYRKIL